MTCTIEIDQIDGVLYGARVAGGEVVDLAAQHPDDRLVQGTIIAARVSKRMAATALADIGQTRSAPLSAPGDAQEGDLIPVQLLSDVRALSEGKSPAVSADLALPGRLIINFPKGQGLRFSRRLPKTFQDAWSNPSSPLDKDGWLIRSAAATATPDDLLAEAKALAITVQTLLPIPSSTAPGTILLNGPSVWQRAIIDAGPITAIQTSNRDLFAKIQQWIAQSAPSLTSCLKSNPVDHLIRLLDDLDQLVSEKVPLAEGGTLWIEPTRALTAMDIDAPPGAKPATINQSAAKAIARHIRLRNLGGQFAVDFLRMPRPADRQKTIATLQSALQQNAPEGAAHLHFAKSISPVGPYLFSRERRGSSLSQVLDGSEG